MDEDFKLRQFRLFLKNFKGIQAVGIIYNDNKPHFVVNIYERQFTKNNFVIPQEFEGIAIEKRKIVDSRLLSYLRLVNF